MSDSTLGYPEPTGYDSDTPLNPQTMGEPRPLADFGAAPGGQAPASVTGGKMDARQRKTDLRMNKRITPTQGVTYSDDIGFNARSVIVDNDTGQWLFDSASRRYVPPGCFGAVLQFPSGSQIANVLWVAPPGVTQPVGIVGSTAVLIYTEDMLEPSSGVIVTGTATSGGTAGAGVVSIAPPVVANVLDGNGTLTTQPSTTTLITVPAGRTWIGQVTVSLAGQNPPVTATGSQGAAVSTSGAGGAPGSGTVAARVDIELAATVTGALSGEQANAAVAGQRLVIVAGATPVSVQLQTFATTGVVTSFVAAGSAIGELQ
jgi:hypothetical protein